MVEGFLLLFWAALLWVAFVLAAIGFVDDKRREALDADRHRRSATPKLVFALSSVLLFLFILAGMLGMALFLSFSEDDALGDKLNTVFALWPMVSIAFIACAIDLNVRAAAKPDLKRAGRVLTALAALSVLSYYGACAAALYFLPLSY